MSITRQFFVRAIAGAAFAATAACGSSSPPGPGPGPTSNPPQILCPADVTVSGVTTPAQAVTYTAPTVTEGTAPVQTTCAPLSGTSFPLGTTTVNCQARDAQARVAACSFKVQLKGMTLGARVFLAIGDSFTEGQNGQPGSDIPGVFGEGGNFVDGPNSYPTKLQFALEGTYPSQGVTVINRGVYGAGKSITVIDENVRKFVAADKPDVLLLEGGYNDLLGDCGTGPTNTPPCRSAIERVQRGFVDCIRHARETKPDLAYIFAVTLTPPGPLGPGARDRRISREAIEQTNAGLRQIIVRERAVLVDVYPLFVGHEAEYVDTDGLHLRPAGYQVMAGTFFAAIQTTVPQTPQFGFSAPR
jgi:lysophospholipase L1-like esterase